MNELEELHNFIRAYFGDFWDGKSEADIVREAINECPRNYLADILKQFNALLPSEYDSAQRLELLKQSGIATSSESDAHDELKLIPELKIRTSYHCPILITFDVGTLL
jgi:hypothetical protein